MRTSAATAAVIRKKHNRWAEEMQSTGWSLLPPELRLYATNGLGERYLVIGWTADLKPIFGPDFVGLQDRYVFTIEPKE